MKGKTQQSTWGAGKNVQIEQQNIFLNLKTQPVALLLLLPPSFLLEQDRLNCIKVLLLFFTFKST